MPKRLIPAVVLALYSAFLVNLLVFKIDLIRVGHVRVRFAAQSGEPNFLPFATILPYLRGEPNWSFAILNLAGNIVPFVPIGFLAPLVFRGMEWRWSLVLAVGTSLLIEGMQAAFGLGIVDIDDVILNALGVMIGYGVFAVLADCTGIRRR